MKAFLDANPNEIITIILESHVGSASRVRAELDTAGLTAQIYDPKDDPDWKVASKGWPTIDWMVSKNKRLVVFTSQTADEDTPIGPIAVSSFRAA